MTRRKKFGVAAALFGVSMLSTIARAATPIHFTPPAFRQGVGHGFFHNIHSRAVFTFRAHAGQHVQVNIVGYGPTRGVVLFPHGGQNGSPGGVVFDDTVHQTGLYRLRVTEDSMANQWRGSVTVHITRH